MKTTHVLTFYPSGMANGLYTEVIDLKKLGRIRIFRLTNIQFNFTKQVWEVKDRNRKILFSNPSRQVCLDWEIARFNQ